MYQQYQFDRGEIARAAESIAATLAETRSGESPEVFAAQVLAERLREAPGDYLQFGPYWWSVKQALRAAGHVFGDTDVVALRAAYGDGLTPHQTLVAGEMFREYYRAQLMSGTATFALDGEDEADAGRYTLFDIDMEILRHGQTKGGLAVLREAIGQVSHEPVVPVFDVPVPVPVFDIVVSDIVQVRFEESGELWTAEMDGGLVGEGVDPQRLVAELQRSGRIGRAIDQSKGIAAVLSDGARPVLIADPQRRVVRINR